MTAILVTGATGTVGSAVVDALRERDAAVRAGVRDPDGFDPRGRVEAVAFDFERPETWGPALDGADRLFLLRPPGVAVDRLTGFADAAVRVGVDHVAYLSVLGAGKNPLLPHRRVERHLERVATAYTFLRASFFAQNLVEVHRADIVERDEVFVPAGDGRTSFVDARDVGAVAAVALTEPGHRNRAYDLTGPEALDYGEVAAVLSDVLDRRIEYADPSVVAFARRMLARGHPPGFVLVMLGIYATVRLGFAGRVTDDAERVLGRPPRTLREFAADHREALAPGGAGPGRRAAVTGEPTVEPVGRPPRALTRAVNPVLERLLRSPLHGLVSDTLLLLTVTGRTTGREYTFPVAYEERGDELLVTTHHTNWWRNLRGGSPVTVHLRGEERRGVAAVTTDDGEVAEYLRSYVERHGRRAGRRVGVRVEGEELPDREQFVAAASGVVLVTVDLSADASLSGG